MPHCYYCGSSDHYPFGCPTKSVNEYGKAIGQIGRDFADRMSYDNVGILRALDKLSEQEAATTEAVYELTDFLHYSFYNLLSEMHLLSDLIRHPKTIEAQNLFEIGSTCLKRGFAEPRMIDEAIRKLDEARNIDPSHFNTYIALGYAYVEKGNYEKATDSFHFAFINGDNNTQKSHALFLKARSLHSQGLLPEAIANFRQALSLKNANPEAHYYLAVSLADNREAPASMAELDAAISQYNILFVRAERDGQFGQVRNERDRLLAELLSRKRAEAEKCYDDIDKNICKIEDDGGREFVIGELKFIREKVQEVNINADRKSYLGICRVIETYRKIAEYIQNMNWLISNRRESLNRAVKDRLERRPKGEYWIGLIAAVFIGVISRSFGGGLIAGIIVALLYTGLSRTIVEGRAREQYFNGLACQFPPDHEKW
jgi:tetratricopeptide (TPR) repeat protein